MEYARIHLTETPPPYCSSCFNAKPDSRFVDFDAAFEGPAFAAGHDTEVAGGGTVTTDTLMICEECLTSGAEQIGLGDITEHEARAVELEQQLEQLSDRLAAQAAHIDQLEKAVGTRADLNAVMVAPEPQPSTRAKQSRKKAAG